MATKAIDKLRIQGNAAPRRGPDIRDAFKCVALHEEDAVPPFVYQGDTGSTANGSDVTTIIHSHPSSAASRRYDHLQRVQQANRGLTSSDFGSVGREGLPSIHFLLQGKPVHGETTMMSKDVTKHQRVGHYKTSAKEVYRARHRMATETSGVMDPGNYFRAIRTPLHDVETNNGGLFSGNLFYLGPSVSGQAAPYALPHKGIASDFTASSPAILSRNRFLEGHACPDSEMAVWSDLNVNGDGSRYLENLTNPGPTPRGSPQGDQFLDFGDSRLHTTASRPSMMPANSVSDLWNPNPTPLGNRHRQTSNFSRRSNRDKAKGQSDPNSLRDCLRVHPSYKVPLQTDMSPRDMVRLKHGPQNKINYNNPYRNLRSKERTDFSPKAGRYIFNSVESYIHFNKIYPRSGDVPNQGAVPGSTSYTVSGLPQIPKLNGFTSHCTDTMMLKMMFEMNKPKSVKSVSKYSDVAVHKDLDEFMIVSTPTVSRSASVVSRRTVTPASKSKSQRGLLKKKKGTGEKTEEREKKREDKEEHDEEGKKEGEEEKEEYDEEVQKEEEEGEREEDGVDGNRHSESRYEQREEVSEEKRDEKKGEDEKPVVETCFYEGPATEEAEDAEADVGQASESHEVKENVAEAQKDDDGDRKVGSSLSEPLLSKSVDGADVDKAFDE